MSVDLSLLPATELVAGYRAKRFSPVEVIAAVLARIEHFDGELKAFRMVDAAGSEAAQRPCASHTPRPGSGACRDPMPLTLVLSLSR